MIGHLKGISQRDSHPRVWMTPSRGMSKKFDRMTWRIGWMPCLWKFSRKSCWAFPSRNWKWRKGVSKKEEDLEPRGFRAGVNLRLGAMRSLSEREREKERKHITNRSKKKEKRGYVCMKYAWNMHEHVTCKNKYIIGKTQSKPTSIRFNIIKHTSKCMKHC